MTWPIAATVASNCERLMYWPSPVRARCSRAHITATSPCRAESVSGYAYWVMVHSRSGKPESALEPDSASMFGPQVTKERSGPGVAVAGGAEG